MALNASKNESVSFERGAKSRIYQKNLICTIRHDESNFFRVSIFLVIDRIYGSKLPTHKLTFTAYMDLSFVKKIFMELVMQFNARVFEVLASIKNRYEAKNGIETKNYS